MAYLFKIENQLVSPNPETLLLSPFKDIWKRDKTKKKEIAHKEFAYIEFMASQKKSNPYKGYAQEIRGLKIQEEIFKGITWKPDNLINEGIAKLVEFQLEASENYAYYMSAKKAASKMRQFFDSVDMNETNERTGNPLWKPKDLTSALMDTEKVLTGLNNLKNKVEEDLYQETKTKAGKEISHFAKR